MIMDDQRRTDLAGQLGRERGADHAMAMHDVELSENSAGRRGRALLRRNIVDIDTRLAKPRCNRRCNGRNDYDLMAPGGERQRLKLAHTITACPDHERVAVCDDELVWREMGAAAPAAVLRLLHVIPEIDELDRVLACRSRHLDHDATSLRLRRLQPTRSLTA
jgi:hypothetical protein